MTEQAKVKEVGYRNTKDFVAVAEVLGGTTVVLDSTEDFDVSGQVDINGNIYTYTSKDDTTNTLTLDPATPLLAAIAEEDPVLYFPYSQEEVAMVALEADDRWVEAIIVHGLQGHLVHGVRQAVDEETVEVDDSSGSWELINILGEPVSFDGGLIREGTMPPASPPVSDGFEPGQPVGLEATGGVKAIYLKWDPVDNYDAVHYKVYGSNTSGAIVEEDVDRFLGIADGPRFTAFEIYNETTDSMMDVDPSTPGFFKVAAVDEDGEGLQSVEVTATPKEITGPDIAVGAVDTVNLTAQAVTADKMEAVMILASLVKLGLIELDGNEGISVSDPTQPNRKTVISATGQGHAFVGQGTFDAADFLDRVNLLGLQNSLNGKMTAANGVTDPTQMPTVTSSYVSQSHGGTGSNRLGMTESEDGLSYATTDTFSLDSSDILLMDKDSTAWSILAEVLSGWIAVGGITRIGSTYYVLVSEMLPGGGVTNSNWWILKYSQAGVYQGYVGTDDIGITTKDNVYPAIGLDDTGLLLVAWVTASGNAYYKTVNPTTGAMGGANNFGSGWVSSITSAHISSLGMSGTRLIISSKNYIYAYLTGAGGRYAADDWPKTTGLCRGLCIAGGKWHMFDGNSTIDFTLNKGENDFFYTWYDDDVSGGSTTAESRRSPINSLAPTKFARWTVSLPTGPPDDGTVDGANTARIYVGTAGGTGYRQTTLVEDVLSHTYDSITYSGTAYVHSSGFDTRPSTSPGEHSSTKVDGSGNPMWWVKGSGPGRMGPLEWDEDGYPTKAPTKAGRASVVTGAAGSVTSLAVAFATPFDTGVVPRVEVTPITTRPDLNIASAGSVTNTGFTLYLYRNAASATIPVDWTASIDS